MVARARGARGGAGAGAQSAGGVCGECGRGPFLDSASLRDHAARLCPLRPGGARACGAAGVWASGPEDPLAGLRAFVARGAQRGAQRMKERQGSALKNEAPPPPPPPAQRDNEALPSAPPPRGGRASTAGGSSRAPNGDADDDVVFVGERRAPDMPSARDSRDEASSAGVSAAGASFAGESARGRSDDDCLLRTEGPPLPMMRGRGRKRRQAATAATLICIKCGSGPFKNEERLRIHCIKRCPMRPDALRGGDQPSGPRNANGHAWREPSPPPPREWATVADMWRSKARAKAPVGGATDPGPRGEWETRETPQPPPRRAWWMGPDAAAAPPPHPASFYPSGWFDVGERKGPVGGARADGVKPGPGGAFPSPMDTWSEAQGGRDVEVRDAGGAGAGPATEEALEGETEQEARKRRRVEEFRRTGERARAEERDATDLRPRAEKHVRRALGGAPDLPAVLRRLGVGVEGGLAPSRRQVYAAYRKALLQYHPDRVSARTLGHRLVAEEAFKAIQGAHARFEEAVRL